MDYIKLGWRNLRRNARRSAVTVLAIAFGYAAINLFSGYIHNVYAGLAEQSIKGERLGHLILAQRGAFDEGKLEPGKYVFSGAEFARISALLAHDADVELVALKLALNGLISNGTASTIFIGEGLDPVVTRRLNGSFGRALGAQLDPARPAAGVVASDLARLMKLDAGAVAVLLTSTLSGQTNALDLEIGGLFNTGNAGTNDKFLLLPLTYVQRLLDTDGGDRIIVLLKDTSRVETARGRIAGALAAAGLDLELRSWRELSAFYEQVKTVFDMIFTFMVSIVLVVVLTSIVNTMSMSIVERTREIGTLRALGMNRAQVVTLFAAEALLLVAAGGLAGTLVTLFAMWAVNRAELSYVPPNISYSVFLQVDFVPDVMVLALLLLALVACAAALLPASRAARLSIVDALGHV
ncbi:MAG: ABC transporter permease [Rhodocyclaceae bacterium]|nr:ABC transporter permease [Rhodocyclaceae bacterium]MBX3669593.1 ABC transporter permease [Rhodocyclaceae bacterium]